jgi:hypothetical protein
VRTTTELRLERLGLLEGPVSKIPFAARWSKMMASAAEYGVRRIWPSRPPLLTRTYLSDERLRPERAGGARDQVQIKVVVRVTPFKPAIEPATR